MIKIDIKIFNEIYIWELSNSISLRVDLWTWNWWRVAANSESSDWHICSISKITTFRDLHKQWPDFYSDDLLI